MLGPLLTQIVESSTRKVFWRHRDSKLYVGVKGQKEWLGDSRYLRWVSDIHDHESAALTVALGEVDRLGLHVLQDLLKFLTRGAALDE